MPVYKLKANGKYGDMPKDYEFQVPSSCTPRPTAQEVEKVIIRLGFNKQAQTFKSAGNFKVEKVG